MKFLSSLKQLAGRLYRTQPSSKENTEESRCHSSRRRTVLFQPDSLRLSTQTLEIFRLCGTTVHREAAISNCTGLKQLFVKGQMCVIFRNTQAVLQLFAVKHMEAWTDIFLYRNRVVKSRQPQKRTSRGQTDTSAS